MGFWGKKKKAVAVAEPYLNKHGWKASDPLVRHPWPPSHIEFAVLRTSETISATTWPKHSRGYNHEISRSPAEYHVDRDLDYDGCVITLNGVSRVGASLHFADVYPDKPPSEPILGDLTPTFVAAVDLDAREHSLSEDPWRGQWARPWLNVTVFDPSNELRQHFDRCLLWASINRASHVGYKVWNPVSRGTKPGPFITDIIESGSHGRVYFGSFSFWPSATMFGAARLFPWPGGDTKG